MKAKILFLAAALAVCSSLVFGMARNDKKIQVTGVLEFYGNGPFARLGLKAQDGTLYYLDAKEGDQKKLGDLHGNVVRVDGTLSDKGAPLEMSGAIVIEVKEWKKL